MYKEDGILVKSGAPRGWSKSVLVSTWYSIGMVEDVVSGWGHDCITYLHPLLHSGVTSREDGVVVWLLAEAPVAGFTYFLHPFRLSCVPLCT